jgi:hypothetical protein
MTIERTITHFTIALLLSISGLISSANAGTCNVAPLFENGVRNAYPHLVSSSYFYDSIPSRFPNTEPINVLKRAKDIVVTAEAVKQLETNDKVILHMIFRNGLNEGSTMTALSDIGLNHNRLETVFGTGYAGDVWTMRLVSGTPEQVVTFLNSVIGREQTIWVSVNEPKQVIYQYIDRLNIIRSSSAYKAAELNPNLQRQILFAD